MVSVDRLGRFRPNDIKSALKPEPSPRSIPSIKIPTSTFFFGITAILPAYLPSVRNIINIAASTSLQQIHRPASMSAKLLQNFIITARHKWAAYEAHAVSHLHPRFLGGCL